MNETIKYIQNFLIRPQHEARSPLFFKFTTSTLVDFFTEHIKITFFLQFSTKTAMLGRLRFPLNRPLHILLYFICVGILQVSCCCLLLFIVLNYLIHLLVISLIK